MITILLNGVEYKLDEDVPTFTGPAGKVLKLMNYLAVNVPPNFRAGQDTAWRVAHYVADFTSGTITTPEPMVEDMPEGAIP